MITCYMSSGPGQGLEEGLGKTDKQEHSFRGPSTCKGPETKQSARSRHRHGKKGSVAEAQEHGKNSAKRARGQGSGPRRA